MGFFGLASWVESDAAADFRYVLQQQFHKFGGDEKKLKRAIQNVVENELDDMANAYNTPGFVNLALCLEDEGGENDPNYSDGLSVFSKYLTIAQLRRADRLFTQEIPVWDVGHRPRLKELHKVITKTIESKRNKK